VDEIETTSAKIPGSDVNNIGARFFVHEAKDGHPRALVVLPHETPDRRTRRSREPPTDAEIERGLRERAVTDPRAAEILLRWLQRPRTEERVGGVDLDSMSERELERVYAGLLKLAALPDEELRALVGSLLAGTPDA
jgi:hypothetical protein